MSGSQISDSVCVMSQNPLLPMPLRISAQGAYLAQWHVTCNCASLNQHYVCLETEGKYGCKLLINVTFQEIVACKELSTVFMKWLRDREIFTAKKNRRVQSTRSKISGHHHLSETNRWNSNQTIQ